MNIVILGTAYPFRGGLATFNERLARQFQQEGHKVETVTFTLQYPSFLFPGKTQYTNDAAPEDLHITRQLNSCNPFNWLRLGRQIRRQQPDILICCYWMAFFAPAYGLICRLAKKNGITKCIALVHNMFPHEKSILDKLFAPYFVKAQDAFVTLSDAVAEDIKSLYSELSTPNSKQQPQVAVSPHPIYDHYGERMSKAEACQSLGLDASKQYLLFFGLVRAYKGLDLLIDALEKVKDTQPNLQLLIAGEFYEDEDKYRQQIADNGLQERVIIRNEFVPDADLRKYFGAADLIVQPYKSATQSGVTQVAFHFEKPILVTNVGGLGEIVHHGKMGYAVAPDSQEIAEAIDDYFRHDRQAAFTAYLQKEKVKYGWDRMTKAFLQLTNQSHD
ncbi:MAG: glycosyltransferase [Paludibacteraceae bacterium]|nr:glycosyltransferase [Paludibacteraceae bacterium]